MRVGEANASSAQGMYHLGVMHASGLGVTRACDVAAGLLKSVAERAHWSEAFEQALALHDEGRPAPALLLYLVLAESGFERAQFNVAYLLDAHAADAAADDAEEEKEEEKDEAAAGADPAVGAVDGGHGDDSLAGVTRAAALARALAYYRRSAAQGHVHSRLAVGDYHYYGRGTPADLTAAADECVAAAAAFLFVCLVCSLANCTCVWGGTRYRLAADGRNAQAAWNLGYMHEHGLGLPPDLHLAKRYFDLAAELSPEAAVPAKLALVSVYAKMALERAGWLPAQLGPRLAALSWADVDAAFVVRGARPDAGAARAGRRA